MNISGFFTDVAKHAKANSPEILAGIGVTGVFTTAYLAHKAAKEVALSEEATQYNYSKKEWIKQYWKIYIPTAISGAITVGSIIGSSQASGRRTAAAVTAFSVSERAFSEYKEKIVEQIGKNQEQKARDEIVQAKVDANPPSGNVILPTRGHIMCCELLTGRYFRSDMETLKRAENEVNQKIQTDLYVMLSEFYNEIGIPHTSQSDYIGWAEKPMELRISAVMSDGPDSEPCLGFDYSYTKPI